MAIMLVLADRPGHGYQIMQAIGERTRGGWRPSPGAIYPALAQLEDEGLVSTHEGEGRKQVQLTTAGRAYLAARTADRGDPFADYTDRVDDRQTDATLTTALDALTVAAQQIASLGTAPQLEEAVRELARSRRALYLILAETPDDVGGR